MQDYQKQFKENKLVVVKELIGKETASVLFDYLRFTSHMMHTFDKQAQTSDKLVNDCFGIRHGDLMFDALMKRLKPVIEECVGMELYPSYSYARLYKTGSSLIKHVDRDSSEIGVTLKLSDTGGYNWPIWMVDKPYLLEDGDAVVYRGHELLHWRETCAGPPDYRMGQVFFFYVDANGPFKQFKYDKRYEMKKIFESEI